MESRSALGVAYRLRKRKEQQYGISPIDIGHSLPCGRLAHLAPQQELGLLPERRARTCRPDSARIGSDGPDLKDKHDEERQRTTDQGRTGHS